MTQTNEEFAAELDAVFGADTRPRQQPAIHAADEKELVRLVGIERVQRLKESASSGVEVARLRAYIRTIRDANKTSPMIEKLCMRALGESPFASAYDPSDAASTLPNTQGSSNV